MTSAARRSRSVLRRSGHFRYQAEAGTSHCHYITRGCHLVFQASVFLTARIELDDRNHTWLAPEDRRINVAARACVRSLRKTWLMNPECNMEPFDELAL